MAAGSGRACDSCVGIARGGMGSVTPPLATRTEHQSGGMGADHCLAPDRNRDIPGRSRAAGEGSLVGNHWSRHLSFSLISPFLSLSYSSHGPSSPEPRCGGPKTGPPEPGFLTVVPSLLIQIWCLTLSLSLYRGITLHIHKDEEARHFEKREYWFGSLTHHRPPPTKREHTT